MTGTPIPPTPRPNPTSVSSRTGSTVGKPASERHADETSSTSTAAVRSLQIDSIGIAFGGLKAVQQFSLNLPPAALIWPDRSERRR